MTIKQAAIKVFEIHNRSLFVEDILEEIIIKDYYHLGARNSLNVLKIEIARSCDNMDYSKPSIIKHFHKQYNGTYSLLVE